VIVFLPLEQHGIFLLPKSFPAKTVLVREQLQTFAIFELFCAKIGFDHFQAGHSPLPFPRATRYNQYQSQQNSVLF